MFSRLKASLNSSSKQQDNDTPRTTRQQRRLSKPPTNRTSGPIRPSMNDATREIALSSIDLTQAATANYGDGSNISPEAKVLLRMSMYHHQLVSGPKNTEQSGKEEPAYEQPNAAQKQKEPSPGPESVSSRPSVDTDKLQAPPEPLKIAGSPIESDQGEWTRHSPQLNSPIPSSSSPTMYGPSRRRSLLATPGVATRFSRSGSEESELKEHTPEPEPIDCVVEEVSEDVIVDYDDDDDDFDSFKWKLPTFIERASTPSDLDYPHLGQFQLGSLRITNGCPSPAPSDRPSMHKRHISSHSVVSEPHDENQLRPAAALAATMLKSEVEVILTPAPEEHYAMPIAQHAEVESRGRSRLRHSMSQYSMHSASRDSNGLPLQADDYTSDLPQSPFSEHRPTFYSNPAELQVRTKTTEMDDDLFDDEAISVSPPETRAASMDNSHLTPESRPPASRTSTENSVPKSDSGYSSNSSNSSTSEARKAKLKSYLQNKHNRSKSATPAVHERSLSLPAETDLSEDSAPTALTRPLSTSSFVTSQFPQMNDSTNSFASYNSSASISGTQKQKPRKLQKKRPTVKSRSSSTVTVPESIEMTQFDVPTVPDTFSDRYSQRNLSLPELAHSNDSTNLMENNIMETDRGFSETPRSSAADKYPSRRRSWLPEFGNKNSTKNEVPRPVSTDSQSFWGSQRSSRMSKLPGECDSDTAFAIIQESDSLFEGKNKNAGYRMSGGRPVPNKMHSYAGPNPSPDAWVRADMRSKKTMTGMDDQTAAQLARRRSRILLEQQESSWDTRRSSFNDRGGVPGRFTQPVVGVAHDAPPLPPMPEFVVDKSRVHRVSLESFQAKKTRPSSMPARGYHVPQQRQSAMELRQNYSGWNESDASNNVWGNISLPSQKPVPPPHRYLPSMPSEENFHRRHENPGSRITRPRSTVGNQYDYQPRQDYYGMPSLREQPSYVDMRQPSPAPSVLSADLTPRFGRYSGGLGYGYTHGAGFVGSAGTRSASGTVSPERKSVELSEGYGVDLSDVPIMARGQRAY